MPAYWICKTHHRRIDRGDECHQCLGAERDALRARVAALEAFVFRWADPCHMGEEDIAFYRELVPRTCSLDQTKAPF